MKNIKWKILVITCLVCIASVIPGLVMWDSLPESMPIHFNINNQPDNFAPKSVAVLFIPCFMLITQIFVCIFTDLQSVKHGQSKKAERVLKWILPIIAVSLQTAMVLFAAGVKVDIRRVAVALVSLEFLFLGNYLPKLNHVKNYKIDSAKARRINRFSGVVMVILGSLGIVSLFLPAAASIVWLVVLIPSVLAVAVYTLIEVKKK